MFRVTQSMLSSNSLRHISEGYKRMGKLEEQLNTGKKITRPSDDPVTAMKGMRYRSEVTEVKQFLDRNLAEVYNWMDNTDTVLDKVTQSVQRIRELTLQAANDSYETNQRNSIATEIDQIIEHIGSLANTKVNNKYIFNGTDTVNEPVNLDKFNVQPSDAGVASNPEKYFIQYQGKIFTRDTGFQYKNGSDVLQIDVSNNKVIGPAGTNLKDNEYVIADINSLSTNSQSVNIEVMKGITVGVNLDPNKVFSKDLFGTLAMLSKTIKSAADGKDISDFTGQLDKLTDNMLSERAELGARYNRMEMVENRVAEQEVIATKIMSENEDIDAERVIMDLKSQEVLHRAALAAGARIMQPTLMDFLR